MTKAPRRRDGSNAMMSSNYHSLSASHSYDGGDGDDDKNRNNTSDGNNHHEEVAIEDEGSGLRAVNPIARLRQSRSRAGAASAAQSPPPPSPPPPPDVPPPLQHRYHPSNGGQYYHDQYQQQSYNVQRQQYQPTMNGASPSLSQYEGFDTKSQMSSHTNTTKASTQEQSKKALISLLQEMRALESKHKAQLDEFAKERAELTDRISSQNSRISELETNNASLREQNVELKRSLAFMITKLDKFATGCWRFSSSSVKKMSEALHVQVREWGREHGIDPSTGEGATIPDDSGDDEKCGTKKLAASSMATACDMEREALEQTTMEKLQSMHLHIMELKDENARLKVQVLRRRRGGSAVQKDVGEADSFVLTKGGEKKGGSLSADNSDEASHLSGVTQLTSATTTTAMTVATMGTTTTVGSTSTRKMMDAMSGFLSEHEPKVKQQQQRKQSHSKRSSNDENNNSIRNCGGKKLKSPRSILKKQSSKYNENQPRGISFPLSPSSSRSVSTMSVDSGGKNVAGKQRREQRVRLRLHGEQRPRPVAPPPSKPPKSPRRSPTTAVSPRHEQSNTSAEFDTSFFDSDEAANFFSNSNDFATPAGGGNDSWVSWVDEKSEV